MRRFDVSLILWGIGIALAVVTITFGFWQLGWISVLNALNLELFTVLLGFTAYVFSFNGRHAVGIKLIGVAIAPLFIATTFGCILGRGPMNSLMGQVTTGGLFLIAFGLIFLWASIMDMQTPPTSSNALSNAP